MISELPAHYFLPRESDRIILDVRAGYGRHNAQPRWGLIATRDIGDYAGRHRRGEPQ